MAKVFVCIRETTYKWSQDGTSSDSLIDIEKVAGTVEVAENWLKEKRDSAPGTFGYKRSDVIYEEWDRGELYIVRFETIHDTITDVRYYIEGYEIEE